MSMTEIERRARLRIYEIALDFVRQPLDFKQTPPAADDLDQIIRELESGFVRLRAAARAAAVMAEVAAADEEWLRPGVIVFRYGIPRQTLHALCTAYPWGSAFGFARQDPESRRWEISPARFEIFLQKFYGRVRDQDGKLTW